jgi:hypothetical protein
MPLGYGFNTNLARIKKYTINIQISKNLYLMNKKLKSNNMEFLETSCIPFDIPPKKYKYWVQFVYPGSHVIHSVIRQNEQPRVPNNCFVNHEFHEFPDEPQVIELRHGMWIELKTVLGV